MELVINILSMLILAITTSLVGYWVGKIKDSKEESKAIKHGLQALLRDRMLVLYQESKETGYTTIENKNNFDNLYHNYHNLGLNGVMDQIHEEYMDLEVK